MGNYKLLFTLFGDYFLLVKGWPGRPIYGLARISGIAGGPGLMWPFAKAPVLATPCNKGPNVDPFYANFIWIRFVLATSGN